MNLNTNAKVGIVAGAVAILLTIIVISWGVGLSNKEVRLRNAIEMQQEECETFFTQMWASFVQRAEIADQHKEAFREVYAEIMQAQPGARDGQDPLMVFLNQTVPNYDQTLYRDLSNRIDAGRGEFHAKETRLLDLSREHTDLITTFPGSVIVGGRGRVEIVTIGSARTTNTYATGEENDLDLFGNE